MPGNRYANFTKVIRIELVRNNFDWLGIGQTKDNEKPTTEYTASIRTLEFAETAKIRSAFAYFALNRKNHEADNFEISANYYFTVRFDEADGERHEGLLKDIAIKMIWSRFYDLAKILLVQSGIEGVDVPLLPDTITSR